MDDRPSRDAETTEISLRALLDVLLESRWLVLAVLLCVLAVAGVLTFTADPVYSASSELTLRQGSGDLTVSAIAAQMGLEGFGGGSDISQLKPWILSRSNLLRAQELLAGSSEGSQDLGDGASDDCGQQRIAVSLDQLRRSVSAVEHSADGVLQVSAESKLPQHAASIANAVVSAYLELDRERAAATATAIGQFLDQQIDIVRATVEQLEEELVAFQEDTGLVLEENLLTSKLTRVEQLLVEAEVELEDRRMQLDSVEKLLAEVRSELLGKITDEEEGTPLLLELQDKINFMLRLQREIRDLERDREESIENESYAEAKLLEEEILQKKEDLEADAAQHFEILNLLPDYEELIRTQLELEIEIKALESRASILQRMGDEETATLMEHALTLARKRRELDIGQTVYEVLLDESQRVRIMEAAELGSVEVIDWAEAPDSPIRPRKQFNLVVALFLGTVGGVGAAFLRHALDTTLRTKAELENVLQIPCLGQIPEIRHTSSKWRFEEVEELLLPHLGRTSTVFHAFSNLEPNLHLVAPDVHLRTLTITSSLPNEGKSMIAANLALASVHNGKRTLLVDADFRCPVLEDVFGLGKRLPGLADLVVGDLDAGDVLRRIEYEGYGELSFLPAGREVPSPTELFSSSRFADLFDKLVRDFELVIFDTPPIIVGAEARILGARTSGTLFVVRGRRTRRETAREALGSLRGSNVRVSGAVLNRVEVPEIAHYYHYYEASSDTSRGGRLRALLRRVVGKAPKRM